jgi:hypothetical protein
MTDATDPTDPADANPDPEPDIDHTDELELDPDDLAALGCQSCLGGFAPAGTHPILGLVYTACPTCQDTCRCCDGHGLFPADTTCPHCLADALALLGLTAVFCHTCAGVLTIHPTEVSP